LGRDGEMSRDKRAKVEKKRQRRRAREQMRKSIAREQR
jgi:hypothetical protein